jgi:archaemetzincin
VDNEIVVVAIAPMRESKALEHICQRLAATFGRTCRVGKGMSASADAYDTHRAQYSAEVILAQLAMEGADRVLGVVDLDLYVPELNFVFGLSDRAGRRAVIALPRLRQSFYGARDDEALFLARVVKEAVHELGHTCGLGHCPDRQCVMAFSNSLADTDHKGERFCTRCAARLRW